MTLTATIEALLFTASHPLSMKKLADLTGAKLDQVTSACDELARTAREGGRGIELQRSGNEVQLVTVPGVSDVVAAFLKAERSGELSRPSLEALTIIAYRGPITKAELDQIRGVNCALILRNLLIRGLIDAEEDARAGVTRYRVSFDFLRHLGLRDIAELPEYGRLHAHEFIDRLLNPTPPVEQQEGGARDG